MFPIENLPAPTQKNSQNSLQNLAGKQLVQDLFNLSILSNLSQEDEYIRDQQAELYQLQAQRINLDQLIAKKQQKIITYLAKRRHNENSTTDSLETEEVIRKQVQSSDKDKAVVTPSTQASEAQSPTGLSSPTTKSKGKRISMSQNYKGSITRGFARFLLKKDQDPGFKSHFERQLKELKEHFNIMEESSDKLKEEIFEYVRKNIQGKVAYMTKNNKSADNAKVGSNKKIVEVFFVQDNDDNRLKFIKGVLHECLLYFLKTNCFLEWIKDDCFSSEDNKKFLIINRDKIIKVFEAPNHHKPRFRT